MKRIVLGLSMTFIVSLCMAQVPQIPVGPNGLPEPEQKQHHQMIMDHQVKLKDRKLQPWTSYDTIFRYTINFLKYCPTIDTPNGKLPYYLVTSAFNSDGSFRKNQNNQGGNAYFAMKTFKRYYAYTGDRDALIPVTRLVEQIAKYITPSDFAWPGMPRTQDDSPDGIYDDEKGEPDKACMVAIAYIDYARFTGEKKYFDMAETMTKTLLKYIVAGNKKESPLPFRVNMRTGAVMDPYCSDMIMAVNLLDELLASNTTLDRQELQQKRQMVIDWIMKYPMENNYWSAYFEDVASNSYANINQQNPMETARYLIDHPTMDPLYKQHILKLIKFVKYRFGNISRYGATSVMEQDACFAEMSSHTSRYASVVAKWFGMSGDEQMREEARASFALASYSAYNKHSKDSLAINYTGIGYESPWLSDSYFDYLSHYMEGIGELPEMIPEGTNHLFYSSSMITNISYAPDKIAYTAYDKNGVEHLKLTFTPTVYANGKPLSKSKWKFGKYRGIDNILTIQRKDVSSIEVHAK